MYIRAYIACVLYVFIVIYLDNRTVNAFCEQAITDTDVEYCADLKEGEQS